MNTFGIWWPSLPHRAKYPTDHPAYLAGKESWDAACELMSAKVAARDAAIADLQAALNAALANQDEVIRRNAAQIELLKSALSRAAYNSSGSSDSRTSYQPHGAGGGSGKGDDLPGGSGGPYG